MKRIVVLGGGESGAGAAVLAKKGIRDFPVRSSEIKPQYKEWLNRYDIRFEEDKHTEELILKAMR